LLFSRPDHPVVVTPESDPRVDILAEYLKSNRAAVEELLTRHGAVLFRGFRFRDAQDFRRCAENLGSAPFNYVGGDTPRKSVGPDVFTATEHPASETISLHNEMSYLPVWPLRLLFFSVVPARRGGQTSLASGRDVLRAIPASIVERFRERKITYIRHFHPDVPLGKTWQATYQTDDRGKLEQIIASQGSVCAWLPHGVLRVTTTCNALTSHSSAREEVWFNQAEQWHPSSLERGVRAMLEELAGKDQLPHDCTYGDGQPLEDEVLDEVRRAMKSVKLLFDWKTNDLLLIDNVLMMHGREPYRGERKSLAYLSAN